MDEKITQFIQRRLLLLASRKDASSIIAHTSSAYSQAASDGDRMTVLLLALHAYEETLQQTRKMATDLIAKNGPAAMVIDGERT